MGGDSLKKVVRDREIKVRLSKRELEKLDEKVAKSGIGSREKFCRACFQNVVIKEQPPKEFFVLISEVRRVGNNLNQVAKRLNCYLPGERPTTDEVDEVIKSVNSTIDLLYSSYTTK